MASIANYAGIPIDPTDLTGAIVRYEAGEFNEEQVVEFFQVLVSTGLVSQLQGSYQREAMRLIRAGLVSLS